MEPKNLLFIMSDEHNRDMLGVNGHPMVRTPHLDALAARGVNFKSAYCNCPICVPSRASFATGRYVHEIGNWDNAAPYDGSAPSWGHRLMDQGHRVVSIGKLHYRDSDDPNGFHEEILPLHVVDGIGDLIGLIRDDMPKRGASKKLSEEAGRGETTYTNYDRQIASETQRWLREQAPRYRDRPWVLFVSFVCPHFPLTAPPEYYDMYPEDQLPWPMFYGEDERPRHPFYDAMRQCMAYDEFFDEDRIRKATAGYFGLCTFLDANIGKVLRTLEEVGLAADTRVVYTSDHGDSLGKRGFWGKSTMFEEAAAVPLIMAGPGLPAGRTVETPVSLVDFHPTIIEAVGGKPHLDDAGLPGRSLFSLLDGGEVDRAVFSEYHAVASPTGMFMIRRGRWKYVHFVDHPPMLFDLDADPHEAHDLADDPAHAELVRELHNELLAICDPDEVEARAKADQRAKIERYGGREAVLARGDFGYSPAPGQKPDFY